MTTFANELLQLHAKTHSTAQVCQVLCKIISHGWSLTVSSISPLIFRDRTSWATNLSYGRLSSSSTEPSGQALIFTDFLDLSVSLPWRFSLLLSSVTLFTHRELDVSHPSIPNIAQTGQRTKKHFPFVHFKQCCSHHGCKPLMNWTYRAKHHTLKKKSINKIIKTQDQVCFHSPGTFQLSWFPTQVQTTCRNQAKLWAIKTKLPKHRVWFENTAVTVKGGTSVTKCTPG